MSEQPPEVVEAEFVETGEPYDFPADPAAPPADANGSPTREIALRPVWRPAPEVSDVVDGWVSRARSIFHLAEEIAPTEFVPEHLRNKPAAVAACILTGRELGLGPMASLKHVQVVKGVPTLSAEYKRARVLGAGHQFDILDRDTNRCVLYGRRRGSRAGLKVTFTLEDARRAKLLKPDSAWATRPRRMLFARASSELCDAIFADVTNGLPTTELIQAGEFDEYAGYDEPPPGAASDEAGPRHKTQRKTPARTPAPPEPEPAGQGGTTGGADEPDLEGAKAEPGEPDPDTTLIDPKHPLHKKIMAQFNEIGVKDRGLRLRAAGVLGGTTVDTLDGLTITQAKAVADALDECIDHGRQSAEGDGGKLNDKQRHAAYVMLGRLVRAEEERRARAENYADEPNDPGTMSAEGNPEGAGDPPEPHRQPARRQERVNHGNDDDDPGPAEPPLGPFDE
jgi:hypothetical protein